MVFYFSGTGNSRFAAERIAKAIGQEAHDITVYTKKKVPPVFIEGGAYVFCCPSYMSALAKAITDFISWASFPKGSKTYFVVTCAASMGITPKVGAELCEQNGLDYMGSAQVVMPQNYIALFTTKQKEDNNKIISEALPVIDMIAETVKNGEKLEEKKIGKIEYSVTKWVRDVYYKDFMKTKKFTATDKCIGCQMCVRICPLNNISMQDNKPVWGDKCSHCMACINRCPKDAIEYGKGSVGKPRYKGPEANLE